MTALYMFTILPHAEMIFWMEVKMHVARCGLRSIVLRSSPQVLGAPEKAVTLDNLVYSALWIQDSCNCDEVGEKGMAVYTCCAQCWMEWKKCIENRRQSVAKPYREVRASALVLASGLVSIQSLTLGLDLLPT